MNGPLPMPVLTRLIIKGRSLLPIVQGGMGVGVSAHRLAGTVASHGAVGTIASVDLRRLHPDLMSETGRCRDADKINSANLVALDREVRAAREIAGGRGLIAVNVMRAVSQYADYIRQTGKIRIFEEMSPAEMAALPPEIAAIAAGVISDLNISMENRRVVALLDQRGELAAAPAEGDHSRRLGTNGVE